MDNKPYSQEKLEIENVIGQNNRSRITVKQLGESFESYHTDSSYEEIIPEKDYLEKLNRDKAIVIKTIPFRKNAHKSAEQQEGSQKKKNEPISENDKKLINSGEAQHNEKILRGYEQQIAAKEFRIQLLSQQCSKLQKQISQMAIKLKQWEIDFENEREANEIERKANEIYSEFYANLNKVFSKYGSHFKKGVEKANDRPFQNIEKNSDAQFSAQNEVDLSMDTMLSAFQELLKERTESPDLRKQTKSEQNKRVSTKQQYQQTDQKSSNNSNGQTQKQIDQTKIQEIYQKQMNQLAKLLEESDSKIATLKEQLVRSTQNNIENIFSKEISAACCIEQQILKINTEMSFLKENLSAINRKEIIIEKNLEMKGSKTNRDNLPHFIVLPQDVGNEGKRKAKTKIIKNLYTNKKQEDLAAQNSGEEFYELSQQDDDNFENQREKREPERKYTKPQKKTKPSENRLTKQINTLKSSYTSLQQQFKSLTESLSRNAVQQNEKNRVYLSQIKELIKQSANQKQEKQQRQRAYSSKLSNLRTQLIGEIKSVHQRTHTLNDNAQMQLQREILEMKRFRETDREQMDLLRNRVIELGQMMEKPERLKPDRNVFTRVGDIGTGSSGGDFLQEQISDSIPVSNISISVEYVREIERLRNLIGVLQQDLNREKLEREHIAMELEKYKILAIENKEKYVSSLHQNRPIQNSKQQQEDSSSLIDELQRLQKIASSKQIIKVEKNSTKSSSLKKNLEQNLKTVIAEKDRRIQSLEAQLKSKSTKLLKQQNSNENHSRQFDEKQQLRIYASNKERIQIRNLKTLIKELKEQNKRLTDLNEALVVRARNSSNGHNIEHDPVVYQTARYTRIEFQGQRNQQQSLQSGVTVTEPFEVLNQVNDDGERQQSINENSNSSEMRDSGIYSDKTTKNQPGTTVNVSASYRQQGFELRQYHHSQQQQILRRNVVSIGSLEREQHQNL